MTRRVVVTGMGVVTALGCETAEFWDNICAGKSGVGPIRRFDCTDFKVTLRRRGPETSTPPTTWACRDKEVKRLDRFVQFAMVAADKAIRQSGIDFSARRPVPLRRAHRQRHRRPERDRRAALRALRPRARPRLALHDPQADGQRRQREHLGALEAPRARTAPSPPPAPRRTNAIGDAFKLIQHDMADVMVTGGSEAAITPMGLSGFARMSALSTRNDDPQARQPPVRPRPRRVRHGRRGRHGRPRRVRARPAARRDDPGRSARLRHDAPTAPT